MEAITSAIKKFLVKILTYATFAVILVLIWNFYKEQREAKTFVVSFRNVEGLAKGAPIYANGVKVGKIIRIFPLGNTSDIGVKGLITERNYPNPQAGVRAKIINNIEGGGGKVLEIGSLLDSREELEARKKSILSKGTESPVIGDTMRLMQNFFQLSKDFGNETLKALGSKQAEEYKENLANSVQNTITSVEYGTVKQDVSNGIERLNKEIKDYEHHPENKGRKLERVIQTQAKALENTVKSYGSLSDVYK